MSSLAMGSLVKNDPVERCEIRRELPKSFIDKLHCIFAKDLPFAGPVSALRTNEFEVVRSILQMLQGLSSALFLWDDSEQSFLLKNRVYLAHLSHTSLSNIFSQFIYGATCLKLVENSVKKVQMSVSKSPPTLMAFANSVSAWLQKLRNLALEEEVRIMDSTSGVTPTLLGLTNSLSSLCSGTEYLFQVVHEAIPSVYFDHEQSVPAGELAVHILDHLYKKLNEVCLVQGGEEGAYQMLLYIFIGSSLPYIEGLDAWLYYGILDDPFKELFFYANSGISISQPEFWEKSYLMRLQSRKLFSGISAFTGGSNGELMTNDKKRIDQDPALISLQGRDQNSIDLDVCPLFLKDMAKAIVSAGKSLQLVQHIPIGYFTKSDGCCPHDVDDNGKSSIIGVGKMQNRVGIAGLTLLEVFCLSLVGLISDGSLISKYFGLGDSWDSSIIQLLEEGKKKKVLPEECVPDTSSLCSEHIWCKFLVETMVRKGIVNSRSLIKDSDCLCSSNEGNKDVKFMDEPPLGRSFCPENPVLTVCQTFHERHTSSWNKLNVSRNFRLPALDDEDLRQAIFSGMDEMPSVLRKTNYMFGFQYGESGYTRLKDDLKAVETLYPFPTLLPPFQESLHIPELFPSQENSTLASRVLNWLQGVVTKATPLPAVIMQDCLIVYIKKQVDCVGKHILLKLMNDWKLVDELAVLRAIYLLGSGDLLQQFLTVLFNKLDKGESWDDEFELNTVLQESIRNSADAMLLNAFDSLVVSITRQNDPDGAELHNTGSPLSTSTKGRNHCFGINALDLLNFTYKVSWPLELIANTMALKKYNQVMCFLLRVKRAKFVLDKARRWMWKGKGTSMMNLKRHWLVEQKLLHFVDAFHQYVMDRVLHSSWLELCEGMASAGSLDEVIEVHEAYLLSIQRQCFVVPDKLWALIASRINSILGLALDFYSIQQTLSSGGAAPAIKARCEIEVDRIEKQFDDCIAFLLRVLSFKLNVGHFPHLADLVTRINYNYFYMSDSGNLLTVPGSESGLSKMGKGIPVRHDP
ncbi:hypothetical protein Scep_000465 [Stephania cephalantha]|uniref:Gamma-tubulin complex component n=1 Tax=Stephania cephalantha TaxID=152367 RepID=A0AAP0L9W5_9MAGN